MALISLDLPTIAQHIPEGQSCITKDYKDILSRMVEQGVETSVIGAVIKAIPLCDFARAKPIPWRW